MHTDTQKNAHNKHTRRNTKHNVVEAQGTARQERAGKSTKQKRTRDAMASWMVGMICAAAAAAAMGTDEAAATELGPHCLVVLVVPAAVAVLAGPENVKRRVHLRNPPPWTPHPTPISGRAPVVGAH